jgi:hypothetical protein
MTSPEEIHNLKNNLTTTVGFLTEYGVTNIQSYGIAKYWAKKHGGKWLNEVIAKSIISPNQEQRVYASISAGLGKKQSYTRTDLAKAGYALDKFPVGPCTLHAMAAVNRMLTAQENGEFPTNIAMRIVSGFHGKGEAHVFVILDFLPVSEDYLNSAKTTKNTIVLDTWYAAQGGPLIFSPKAYTKTVGDYLMLGTNTKLHFSSSIRGENQLLLDKISSEKAVTEIQRDVGNIVIESKKFLDQSQNSQERRLLGDFIEKNENVINDLDGANTDELNTFKKQLGLDLKDTILKIRYNDEEQEINIRVQYNSSSKAKWLASSDVINMLRELKHSEPKTTECESSCVKSHEHEFTFFKDTMDEPSQDEIPDEEEKHVRGINSNLK